MADHLLCLAILWLAAILGAQGQNVDFIDNIVSQALSVYTDFRSILTATATSSSATPSVTRSSRSLTPSTTSFSTPTPTSTLTPTTTPTTTLATTLTSQSASNTAEAAAASSSAAAAIAAANAKNSKNRTTAIALGVVFGLLALAALIGLIFFCLRRRRRQRAKASPRSVSPEAVGGAPWRKEQFENSGAVGNPSPSHFSPTHHHRTPVLGAIPPVAENNMNGHAGYSPLNERAPIPRRDAPNYDPGLVNSAANRHQSYPGSPNGIPLSSHSRSAIPAAVLGGAALGGMAARHHHDKNDEKNFDRPHHEHHQGIARKPIGGTLGDDGAQRAPNMGVSTSPAPEYQPGPSGPLHGDSEKSPFHPAGNRNSPPFKDTNPPAYNGSAHPLSSHPPTADNYRHSTGHSPMITGAAAAAMAARHHDPTSHHHHHHHHPDPSPTSRRSWDPNRQAPPPPSSLTNPTNLDPHRQSPHPPSILTKPTHRRASGSTNPYVPARSPKRARFSGDLEEFSDRRSSRSAGAGARTDSNSPDSLSGGLRQRGEGGDGEEGEEEKKEKEEQQWYRGRYIGDQRKSGEFGGGVGGGGGGRLDSRFYADRKGVGGQVV